MCRRMIWSCWILLLSIPWATAQTAPVIEVRAKSVSGILEYAEYLGDLANQAEVARQGAEFLKSAIDPKTGLDGIDASRPIGLYAYMTADVVDSPIVLMLPLADQDAFLNLITARLSLDPRKDKDGSYTLEVPMLPEPLKIRFANKYAYLIGSYGATSGEVTLIDPKVFFPKSKTMPILDARVFVERIPDSVRKAIIANAELKFADAKDRDEPGETPALKKLRQWALDQGLGIAVQMLSEAKVLGLSFDIDQKSDLISVDVELKAKPGSKLQEQFAAMQDQPGLSGPWLAMKPKPTFVSGINLKMGSEQKKSLGPIIETLFKELGEQANGPEQKAVRMVLDALKPTIKAAELNLVQVVPADIKLGQIPILVGLKVVEGKKIEETIKKLEILIPEDLAKLSFDVKKVGGFTYHKVELLEAGNLPDVVGTNTIWLGISDSMILATVEKEAKLLNQAVELVKDGGKPSPMFVSEGSMVDTFRFIEETLVKERVEEIIKEVFGGKVAGNDRASLSMTSQDGLRMRASLNGKVIKFLVMLDAARKE